ncbi:hypothetical protein [Marinobacterium lutimaris]|uniref:Uncharacterized protein n=1 Tax=Marinobacterium lutimaris TaxID=568106 RepID=A0A1H5UB39_9GAMM|nr:hypothetical protein [Marinobacterium lutimaris]SEF71551.1 hypothetical protein SAMN05444390_101307 [Marinobacterium lutimaris]
MLTSLFIIAAVMIAGAGWYLLQQQSKPAPIRIRVEDEHPRRRRR